MKKIIKVFSFLIFFFILSSSLFVFMANALTKCSGLCASGTSCNANNISCVQTDDCLLSNLLCNGTALPADFFYTTDIGNPIQGKIVWLNSASPQEFNGITLSTDDGHIGSQCSQASLAEIMNYYLPLGQNGQPKYTVYQVEQKGTTLGVWDTYNGLTFHPTWWDSFNTEAQAFGFKVVQHFIENPQSSSDLDTILTYVKQGHPMIVSAYKHWYVLYGVSDDGQTLYTLDSSAHNITFTNYAWPSDYVPKVSMPRSQFLDGFWWYGGYAVLIEPK